MPVTHSEIDAARARLARNEVLGIRNYAAGQADFREAAFQRFLKVCKPNSSARESRHLFGKMIELLKTARLTMNFNANSWFETENRFDTYTNCFERVVDIRSNKKYLQQRDDFENELYRYDGKNYKNALPHDAKIAQRQIFRYGVLDSKNFDPAIRPRYGAVDFGFCREGGASGYGKSFFILKEYTKHAATYSHTDSFKVNVDLASRKHEYNGREIRLYEATGTYFELEKIILYCTPKMLGEIYKYATGQKRRGSELGLKADINHTNYLEFQLHSDVVFNRDIEAMIISISEINAHWTKGYGRYQIRKHAERFAKKHNIELFYEDI